MKKIREINSNTVRETAKLLTELTEIISKFFAIFKKFREIDVKLSAKNFGYGISALGTKALPI